MKLIEELSDMISEEIEDATRYAKCALKHKDERPELAKTFYDISTDELRHMNLIHEQVVGIIEQYRRDTGDPPPEMMAVYDYLHKKQIEKTLDAKKLQEMYRG